MIEISRERRSFPFELVERGDDVPPVIVVEEAPAVPLAPSDAAASSIVPPRR